MAKSSERSDDAYLARYRDQLSDTTQRAKWISGTDQRADRDGQTLATRDHDVIMQWATDRKADPATIRGTEHGGRPGVLRFDFPGYDEGGQLAPVSWDKWFETFDDRELVFDYQEHTRNHRTSNFFKLDSPHRERE